jgi:hypothetical protein
MLDGEIPAGTTHAGHDLIRNEEHTTFTADFSDRLQISRRRENRSERGPAHWLKNEAGCLTIGISDRSLELGRVLLSAAVASVVQSNTQR